MAERIMQLLHNASTSSANVKIKNAMNPIVKILMFLMPCAVCMMIFGGEAWIKILGSVFSSLVVFVALGAYLYFMFRKPQMLQSEEYQIQRQALEIIQQQGIHGNVELTCTQSLPDTTSPQIEVVGGDA